MDIRSLTPLDINRLAHFAGQARAHLMCGLRRNFEDIMAELLPFDERDGALWFDGKIVPWRDAKVHVLTHALHFASCVFEGERMYSGRIYKLKEHTERLFASAAQLGITIPYTEEEINRACYKAAEVQNLKDAYVRPVVFRGAATMPTVAAQHAGVHVAVAVWPWASYFDPKEKLKGIRLDISEWRRPAPDTIPAKAKAAGLYMICTLSKHAAEAKGYSDALMFDYRGLVAEATGANVFFVKDGQLHTPTPDCFLDGITRRSVCPTTPPTAEENRDRPSSRPSPPRCCARS